jgi:hypothetical protein
VLADRVIVKGIDCNVEVCEFESGSGLFRLFKLSFPICLNLTGKCPINNLKRVGIGVASCADVIGVTGKNSKSIEGHRMEIVWTFIGNRMDFDDP